MIKLSKLQRDYIDKITTANPTIKASSIIGVLGSMKTGSRTSYLKNAYLNLLETHSSEKLQEDIASSLDIIDMNAFTNLELDQKQAKLILPEPKKVKGKKKDEGNKTFDIEKRLLTPSELLDFQETILDFFMQNPESNPSNIDMSIYHDIDERSYSILLNQAKFIHKIINSSMRLVERKCSFCNESINEKHGAKGVIVAGESIKKLENNDFKLFHETCYTNYLKKRKVESAILQKSKKKFSSYIPIPKTAEELELEVAKLGIRILSHEENNSISELIVRNDNDEESKFKTLIFDSKTGNLYLDEELITDLFMVKQKISIS